jgi:tetratricopeptide (TPR) repeat protein
MDPEAADYDEAADLFFQGLRLARTGDLSAARAQIATAYLLDSRSINFSMHTSNNPEIQEKCLDLDLLIILTQANEQDMHQVTYGGHVLRIFIGRQLGDHPIEGQNALASALLSVNYLLQRVREQPQLGGHHSQGGALGGCMSYSNLLLHRATIFMAMGNRKKAAADLTKALEDDPQFHKARDARASLWANLKMKDDEVIFNEYKKLVQEVHPDNRGLEVAYAWMAIFVLRDAKLGTLEDAKQYYTKCLRASMRKAELYGANNEPPIMQMVKNIYAETMRNPAVRKLREQFDVAVATGRMEEVSIPEGFETVPKEPTSNQMTHMCLNCGKTAVDIGRKLYKCSQCKKVSYCSAECQRADWKKVCFLQGQQGACRPRSSSSSPNPLILFL